MAVVTRTIGTVGRNYSTITAWEADLDNAAFYSSGDDAVGECYNDSIFDETFVINGGATIGLSSRTLTVAPSERHDGTAGNGARIVPSSAATIVLAEVTGAITTVIEWLEMDAGSQDFLSLIKSSSISFTTALTYNNLILHDTERTNGSSGGVLPSAIFGGLSRAALVHNNIIYDIFGNRSGGTALVVIEIDHDIAHSGMLNNTINNCGQLNASNTAVAEGVAVADTNSGYGIVNNIITDITNAGSGAGICYNPASPSTIDMDHNLSSDTTASGTGSLTSRTAANQYVSTTGGSEDLHLKSGADAIDAGSDLGTTPSGVEIDIDGRDRDAEADTWDMGADEFVSSGNTLVANSGSYTYTGAEAELQRGLILSSDSGTYTYTGTAADLTFTPVGDFILTADAGAYTYSGTIAGLLKGSNLAADSGSYTYTGIAAELRRGLILSLDSGSYAYTGTAAALTFAAAGDFTLSADSGVYSYVGTAASLIADRLLVASSGSYSYTGTAVDLLKGFSLTAESGSYTYTGTSIGFVQQRILEAISGAYVYNGTNASLTFTPVAPDVPIADGVTVSGTFGNGIAFTASFGNGVTTKGKL